jgi:hypothetical protein
MNEAIVVGAGITAGHDGHADLVVHVRHENGVVTPVVLDGETGLRLLAGANDIETLIGRSWRDVLSETVLGGA